MTPAPAWLDTLEAIRAFDRETFDPRTPPTERGLPRWFVVRTVGR